MVLKVKCFEEVSKSFEKEGMIWVLSKVGTEKGSLDFVTWRAVVVEG